MAHLHDVDFRLEMFQPQGTNIEAPWEGRTPRADFTLQAPEHLIGQLIQEVANIITHQHHIHVVRVQRYTLALCLVQLPSVLERDVLVGSGPVLLGNWFHGTFVKHDQLANWRNSPYTREGWLMILGIPLNLKTRGIIERITNLCGEFVDWHYRDRVLGRVLVKARYKSANDVPSCIVFGDAMAYGGNGQTWTFHVYVLNGEPTDILPANEDLLPIWQMLPPPNQHHNNNQPHQHFEDEFNDNMNQNEEHDDNQMILDQNQNDQPQDSISVHDFTLNVMVSPSNGMEFQNIGWQIIPFGLPIPALPIRRLPELFCKAIANAVFAPLLLAVEPPLLKPIQPSPVKRHRDSFIDSKVARALPFSVSGVDATDKMIQPKAKKVKSKVPISTENLRRSLRFVGQEKVNLAYDTPRKRSKVQPISKVLSLGPAVISSKELPPPIPVQQLQKIGTEKCGMLPEEVASDKLLKPRK
ncbi:Os08g0317566 [Oryza sativa Japonica Group]|uniref:Os08g0317566 protein n=1 Tax=Oryza sativa subsp. japonica TaxID=39947 RepID=A0A0P0XEJ7_ORYSJ|nr:Os08g0317566 [Oryza sativa Japonica Group]